MIKAAIFDVDGTLLDSMPIWKDAGARYLKSIGTEPEEKLSDILWNMSIPEGVAYMKEHYKIPFTEEEITNGILSTVRDFYYYEAPLKAGVLSFLKSLKDKEIPMVIATSSDRRALEAAFKRTGIDGFFEKIFTCEEVGAGKTSPLIYEVAGSYLGVDPSETYVFEDVIYAIKSAKAAHFKVVGLYDESSAKHTDLIREKSNLYLKDFTEAQKFWEYAENES